MIYQGWSGAVRAEMTPAWGIRKGFREEVTSKLVKEVGENERVSRRRNSMNKSQEAGGGMEGPGECGGFHLPGAEGGK